MTVRTFEYFRGEAKARYLPGLSGRAPDLINTALALVSVLALTRARTSGSVGVHRRRVSSARRQPERREAAGAGE
jgi:hypothetical protein